MECVLEVNNLEKKYGKNKVINSIDMHVENGSIYGLIGKNGAGKTTLIRIITGLQRPTSGSYAIFNIAYDNKLIKESRKRVGSLVETPCLYNYMTAKENLIEQFKVVGNTDYNEIDELLKLVGIEELKNKRVKTYSMGMKQRLGIAIALANHPDFLILDEPINGVDPKGIVEIRELILDLNKKKGITILISSHYLDELSKVATYYGFIDNGKIIKEISAKDLEKKMRKKIELIVDNLKEAVKYLESKHLPYEVIDNKCINIYDDINVTKIVLDLSKKKCIVEKIHETDETLENYFLNLVGGESNE